MTRRFSPALVIAGLLAGRGAHADLSDTARDVGEAVGYGVPAIAAAITTVANGTAWAYGSAMGQGWRIAGWVAGGVEVAIGAALLATERDDNYELAIGVIPVVLGTASILTATVVDREVTVGVAWMRGGGGASLRLCW